MGSNNNNNNNNNKVKMFFFPYRAGGHLLPMIDMAKFFASSHPLVEATVITTPKTAALFQSSTTDGGGNISFLTLQLPLPDDISDENFITTISFDQRDKILASFRNLKEPLQKLLFDLKPHCFVSDLLHSWTIELAYNAAVPWIVFHSSSLFVLCVEDYLARFKPHQKAGSDYEPFLLSGLKDDSVSFTRSRLPGWHRGSTPDEYLPGNMIPKACSKSFAMVVNSCSEFEGEFRERASEAGGARRVCMVGPVSLHSARNVADAKVESEKSVAIIEWLNSKEPNSVVYVSFGSEANLGKAQFHEIAHGLEGSGQPFIWVVRPNFFKEQGDDGWFPEGFESRVRSSNQGLIIKNWAPQLVILGHASLGAFVTHCGWNSFLEGLSNGVPMITWPLSHDQFYIESLVVDVLNVGIRVGNEEWIDVVDPPRVTVTRDRVEATVRRVMSGEKDVEEMRSNVKEYALKCKMSVQEGGSSYQDACALVEELIANKKELPQ